MECVLYYVILSDFPYNRKVIKKYRLGKVVSPEEPESIADEIKKMLNNKRLRNEMGKRGRKVVMKKYNWDMEKVKLIELYRRI